MPVTSVFVLLLLCACALQVSGFDFPSDSDDDRRVSSSRPCRAKDRTVGLCVSLLSGSCTLYRSTTHLLLRRPIICSLTQRDAVVCCPIAAVRGAGGGTTAVTQRPTRPGRRTTQPPFRPIRTTQAPFRPIRTTQAPFRPIRTTQAPFRPIRTTQAPFRTEPTTRATTKPSRPPTVVTRPPPGRATSPASPPRPLTRPTSPEPRPTPPSGPRSSTRDLQSPIGLRPRPSLAPIVVPPSPRTQRGFRLPGCGIRRPIAAFHVHGDYFQRPPQSVRSERVQLGLQPWTALIGMMEPGTSAGGRWICAGALLTPRIVLTSAQCVLQGGESDLLLVGLGEHDLKSRTDGVAGNHPVLAVEFHPAWSQPERRHSLALLLLGRPADQNPLIQPVCLPPPDPAPALTPLLPIAGTGVMEVAYDLDSTGMSDASARSRLVTTTATVAPLRDCVAALAGAPLTEFLFPGGPQAEPDLCLAASAECALDVGAPVVAVAEDGTVQLEGIQLLDGCSAGQPRLLLRVRHYVPFIVETIEKMMQRLSTNSF